MSQCLRDAVLAAGIGGEVIYRPDTGTETTFSVEHFDAEEVKLVSVSGHYHGVPSREFYRFDNHWSLKPHWRLAGT
ncbi:hypothetical protein [Mycolicibacterium sp.]|uniref:hypothetical protein n=1 Tax=Mycolicibacterium sp. TaxID=2320850 RepID=UPI00355DF739